MESTIFQVNEEPYCLWDDNLKRNNKEFLSGFDPSYFEYNFDLYINSENEQQASVALRLSLHHAIETLFSLIGAYVQAPDCSYAWLAKCSTTELRDFVRKINDQHENIFTKLNLSSVNWESISSSIFHTYFPNTEKQTKTIKLFAKLWSRLASELINITNINEYNALKHGFRARSGGFALSIGRQSSNGSPSTNEEMKLLGRSNFGSSFFTISPLSKTVKTRSLGVSKTSINWSIEQISLLHQLTQNSINNVITALNVINGEPPSNFIFLRPDSDEDFELPWKYSIGVTNMTLTHSKSFNDEMLLTKEDIQKIIDNFPKT